MHAITSTPPQTFPFESLYKDHQKLIDLVASVAFAALGIAAAGAALWIATPLLGVALGVCAILSFAASAAIVWKQVVASRKQQESAASSSSALSSPPPASANNREERRNYLQQIVGETLADLRRKTYRSPDGQEHAIDISEAVAQTLLFHHAENNLRTPLGNYQTRISLERKDCLLAAEELVAKGSNPIILDPANARYPGGGYLRGASALEEDLCRRTGLAPAIDPQQGMQGTTFFPLPPTGGIYVPPVPVFRAGSDTGYQYLNHPFSVAFGVVAAINRPPLSEDNLRINTQDAATLRGAFATFCEMAHQKGHRSLVVTALGCGAFRNPPGHVAEILLEVIQSQYPHCFEEIVFSVIDDHNTHHAHNPEGNFIPFARAVVAAGGTVIEPPA